MDGIIVGVDRSPGARAALSWAVREGELRQLPVTVVHAWGPTGTGSLKFSWTAQQGSVYENQREAEELLAELVLAAKGDGSGGELRSAAVQGAPAAALALASVGADQLVVGTRGAGGFSRLLLGSVSDQLVRHAPVTVTVVPRDHDRAAAGAVVVGVDGSEPSRVALARAAEEARARNAPVRVLYVRLPVRIDPGPATSPGHGSPLGTLEEGAHRVLWDEIREVLGRAPGVELLPEILVGEPSVVLLEQAVGARLLVVGSRGRGGFSGLLLGSVGSQCVHHAPCPVSVIRGA